MKPRFLYGVTLQNDYYKEPNPYKIAPSCNVNLLELSRYAKQQGKKLIELTGEEVRRFSIHPYVNQ